ncbi:hypothetical protein Trydic_g21056 [Trypoxylus dichotomus]
MLTDSRTAVLKDDSVERFSDYYFRDSFEHSSSESQLVENNYRSYDTNPSHRSSRSQTPLSHSHIDGPLLRQHVGSVSFRGDSPTHLCLDSPQANLNLDLIRVFPDDYCYMESCIIAD